MSEPAESTNAEVRIDRDTGELAADLMRETAAMDVLSAKREYEATGHHQTGVSSLTLENMETAALLLEDHGYEEARRRAQKTWHPLPSGGWSPGPSDGISGEDYVNQKAAEVLKIIRHKRARNFFLHQDLHQIAESYKLSAEEFALTFNSDPNDPARQKLLSGISGTEDEIAEKIAQARSSGSLGDASPDHGPYLEE